MLAVAFFGSAYKTNKTMEVVLKKNKKKKSDGNFKRKR